MHEYRAARLSDLTVTFLRLVVSDPVMDDHLFCYYERDIKKMMVFFVLVSVTLQTLVYCWQFDRFASFSFQFGTLFAMIPIMLYNEERGNVRHKNLNRWFFYVYYPANMALLLIILTMFR